MTRLANHVAVVTGGAQEIGGAIARRLRDRAGAHHRCRSIARCRLLTGQALVVDGGMTIQLQEDLGVCLGRYAQEHPETEIAM